MQLLICALFVIVAGLPLSAQKLITYEAGMGSRSVENPDVWILYQKVKAKHEGMTLIADSALLNTKQNDFTAFRNIKIVLSDTTTITGSQLYYDGMSRIAHIWGDTVVMKDGSTTLKTDRLIFDRNTSTAYYETWGHAYDKNNTLDSRVGQYNTDLNLFTIHGDVVLRDSSSVLLTDTLYYNTNTKEATFVSPTQIHSDSTHIFSEWGSYNTGTHYSTSYRNSRVENGQQTLTCDTLLYNEESEHGIAYGHVVIHDSVNDVTCYGRYGETHQQKRYSYVTDSALVIYVDKGDSLFIHADTLYVENDSARQVESIRANYHVRLFRNDVQGMCDSVFYSIPDSLISMYYQPVVWYESYQCTADTIHIWRDSVGMKRVEMHGNSFIIEQVDPEKFNQIKGRRTYVFFEKGEPTYADILGSAQMVYYITEEDAQGNSSLIGVNAGVGSDMRIYFKNREADRVATYGNPDMHTYPYSQLPEDQKKLRGFDWKSDIRPENRHEIFPQLTK